MQAHDKAYYDQLEVERGPITLEEYARLRVSAERGVREATMAELDLPQSSLMPVERVWLRKATTDNRVSEMIENAINVARDK